MSGQSSEDGGQQSDTKMFQINDNLKYFIAGGASGFSLGSRSIYNPTGTKVLPEIVGSLTHAAVFFTTYENMKKRLGVNLDNSNRRYPLFLDYSIAAVVSELVASTCSLPIQSILTERAYTTKRKGTGFIQSVKVIWKTHGIHGFYKDQVTRLVMDLPAAIIFFPTYEYLKVNLKLKDILTDEKSGFNYLRGFVCGAIAGSISGSITTPLHTSEKQIVTDLRTIGRKAEFKEFLERFKKKKTRGFFRLYSGLITRTISSSIVGGLLLGTYEITMWYL